MMYCRNGNRGIFLTFKVSSCGGKVNPDLTKLFSEIGCKRQFILNKLRVTDHDKEYRLPLTNTDENSVEEYCKVCTCCSHHFKVCGCAAATKNELILNILKIRI